MAAHGWSVQVVWGLTLTVGSVCWGLTWTRATCSRWRSSWLSPCLTTFLSESDPKALFPWEQSKHGNKLNILIFFFSWLYQHCVCVCRDLEEALEMGVDWSLREGYAWAEDKEHCEEYGRMLQADPNKVSSKAKKRGLPQVHMHLQGKIMQSIANTQISCSGSPAVVV